MACHGRAADGGCRLVVPRVQSGAAPDPGSTARQYRATRQALAKASGIEAASVHRYRTKRTPDGWPHIRTSDPMTRARAGCPSVRAARSPPWTSRRCSRHKRWCSGSWPSSPTSVISWTCAARWDSRFGVAPRHAQPEDPAVAWLGVDLGAIGASISAAAPWLAGQDLETPPGVAHAGPSWTSRNGSGDRRSRSSSSCPGAGGALSDPGSSARRSCRSGAAGRSR